MSAGHVGAGMVTAPWREWPALAFGRSQRSVSFRGATD